MAKPFVEDGVHPQVIIKSYRKAVNLVSSSFRMMNWYGCP
jgi:chaperonin GroEL (HSP60 family)